MKPLTHHEILTLVGPFARAGRHVDLQASDRQKRRLNFRIQHHEPGSISGLDEAAEESVQIENPRAGHFRLLRQITTSSGLKASLEVQGKTVEQVFQGMDSIALPAHFSTAAGPTAALNYRLKAGKNLGEDQDWEKRFMGGSCQVHGRLLEVDASAVPGMPAEIRLNAHPDGDGPIPDDLLAVIGRHWRPLDARAGHWKGTIKLPKREPARSGQAQERFLRTVEHLQQVLGDAPSAFHERFSKQRWVVVWRRLLWIQVGMLGMLFMLVLAMVLDFGEPDQLPIWMNNVPPMLLLAAFMFWSWEIPRFEFPPRPKPILAASWQAEPGAPRPEPVQETSRLRVRLRETPLEAETPSPPPERDQPSGESSPRPEHGVLATGEFLPSGHRDGERANTGPKEAS